MAVIRSRSGSARRSGSTTCRARRSVCRSPGWPRPRRRWPGLPSATSRRRGFRAQVTTRRSALRRLFLDTTPLRLDPHYRMLWAGQVVNGIGTQITRIALPFQVYVLTGSTLAIAALTACQLVPLLLFSLGAGSVADAVDRRRLLAITQVGMACCSAALVLLALGGSPPLIAILAVAF